MSNKKSYQRPVADVINALESYQILAGSVVTSTSTETASEEARDGGSSLWDASESPSQKSLFEVEEN